MKHRVPGIVGSTPTRMVVATVVLLAFSAFVGGRLFPSTPWFVVVGGAVAGSAVAVAVLAVVAALSLVVRRFVLDHGGTDVQWLWFGDDPPGLKRLRARAGDATPPKT